MHRGPLNNDSRAGHHAPADLNHGHNAGLSRHNVALLISHKTLLLQAGLKFLNLWARVPQASDADDGMVFLPATVGVVVEKVKLRPLTEAQQINALCGYILAQISRVDDVCFVFRGRWEGELVKELGVNEVDLSQVRRHRADVQAGSMLHRPPEVAVSFHSKAFDEINGGNRILGEDMLL